MKELAYDSLKFTLNNLLLCVEHYALGDQVRSISRMNGYPRAVDSLLENVTTSSKEYAMSKKGLNFNRRVQEMLASADTSNTDIFSHKLSSEPDSTQNTSTIHVYLTDDIIRKRRFYPDDTLEDILYWIGTISHEILQNITSKEWCLLNRDTSPKQIIQTDNRTLKQTLQSLGW